VTPVNERRKAKEEDIMTTLLTCVKQMRAAALRSPMTFHPHAVKVFTSIHEVQRGTTFYAACESLAFDMIRERIVKRIKAKKLESSITLEQHSKKNTQN